MGQAVLVIVTGPLDDNIVYGIEEIWAKRYLKFWVIWGQDVDKWSYLLYRLMGILKDKTKVV